MTGTGIRHGASRDHIHQREIHGTNPQPRDVDGTSDRCQTEASEASGVRSLGSCLHPGQFTGSERYPLQLVAPGSDRSPTGPPPKEPKTDIHCRPTPQQKYDREVQTHCIGDAYARNGHECLGAGYCSV